MENSVTRKIGRNKHEGRDYALWEIRERERGRERDREGETER